MKIIKLRTTASTNSFLKELAKASELESFTVVVTEEQTKGRGQVNQKWISEPFKNLIFSTFVSFDDLQIANQKYLNYAVSLAVFKSLQVFDLPKLTVKWPNDILSEKKKLCGILIESQLKKSKISSAIIGMGLNVNQVFFENLPNATSIKKKINEDINLDDLLEDILNNLKGYINLLVAKNYFKLEEQYLQFLYKYNQPAMFKNTSDKIFMGKIIGVSSEGKLQLELEDETIAEFGIKEISFM